MEQVTDATFEDEVLGSEVPVLLEFTAPWCKPCRTIEPILGELAEEQAGRVRVVALDVDENLGTPSRYGVLTVPTVMLFVNGEARVTLLGANPKRRYLEAIAPHLA
ncbi:MAG: thioredoxin family protein [Gaiella sp.]